MLKVGAKQLLKGELVAAGGIAAARSMSSTRWAGLPQTSEGRLANGASSRLNARCCLALTPRRGRTTRSEPASPVLSVLSSSTSGPTSPLLVSKVPADSVQAKLARARNSTASRSRQASQDLASACKDGRGLGWLVNPGRALEHQRSMLCGALGNPLYSRLFAYFISDAAPIKLPGAQFLASAVFLLLAFGVSLSLM